MSLVRTFCMLGAAGTLSAWVSSAGAAVMTNGGFETGDFTGWTLSRNLAQSRVDDGYACTGEFAACFGQGRKLGFASQTIPTEPGHAYTLSFALLNEKSRNNLFVVRIDGNVVGHLADASRFDWTPFSVDFVPTDSQTTIDLGFGHVSRAWHLDDVQVTHVPEPSALALVGAAVVLLTARRRAS